MKQLNCLKILVFFLLITIVSADNALSQTHKKKKKKTIALTTVHTSKKRTTKNNTPKTRPVIRAVERPTINQDSTKATSSPIQEVITSKEQDTTTLRVVTITSAFKPSLRSAAKVYFTAATPFLDTTRIPLSYQVPSQNLFFSYQPVPIKPLALVVDTAIIWKNNAYAKIGYGNYSTPYIEAGCTFDSRLKHFYALHAKHVSSKGDIPLQDQGKTDFDATGIFSLPRNTALQSTLYFNNNYQYKYGSSIHPAPYTKSLLEQSFNTIGVEAALQNKTPNKYSIVYRPEFKAIFFSDKNRGKENAFLIRGALNKSEGRPLSFDVDATADLSTYKVNSTPNISVSNNVFYLAPSVQFKTPNLKLNVGIKPTWDNSSFYFLPNISSEFKVKKEFFVLQAGWVGYLNKNTYRSLTQFNPWIEQPNSLKNTKVTEVYGGFKGVLGQHITYNARASILKFNQQPLFVNDYKALYTQSYQVIYEEGLSAFQLHGELNYALQEKMSIAAAVTYKQFTGQTIYYKPYGILPLELTGSFKYKLMKDLFFKSDLFLWDGTYSLTSPTSTSKLSAVADVNAGVEFNLMPHLNLWMQFNNLFNTHYHRWNQYEAYGFNVLGGVVYSFR